MTGKPTYQELEHRIEFLENELHRHKRSEEHPQRNERILFIDDEEMLAAMGGACLNDVVTK
jgi:hypothetical protein